MPNWGAAPAAPSSWEVAAPPTGDAWSGDQGNGQWGPGAWAGAASDDAIIHNTGPAAAPAALGYVPARNARGMVIAITVPKGGAGKTTLALNSGVWLGRQLRATGRKVCIVDANFQQPDIGKTILEFQPNISTLVRSLSDIVPDQIHRHILHKEDLACDFLLGPPSPEEANSTWITPRLYSDALNSLRQLYDYIILDTPVAEPHHVLFNEFILPQADFLMIAINPHWPTVHNAYDWLNFITKSPLQGGAGVDPRNIGIVLNSADDKVGLDEDEVRGEFAAWNYLGAIPYDPAYKLAANQNRVLAVSFNAQQAAPYWRIFKAVTGEEALVNAAPNTGGRGGDSKRRGLFKRR